MPKVLSSSAKLRLEKERNNDLTSTSAHHHRSQQQHHHHHRHAASSSDLGVTSTSSVSGKNISKKKGDKKLQKKHDGGVLRSLTSKKKKKKPPHHESSATATLQQRHSQVSPPLPQATTTATADTPLRQQVPIGAATASSSPKPKKKSDHSSHEKSAIAVASALADSSSCAAGSSSPSKMKKKKRKRKTMSPIAETEPEAQNQHQASMTKKTIKVKIDPLQKKKQKQEQADTKNSTSASTAAASTSATTTTAATANASSRPKSSLKRKRTSPFRIKVGCVVALRMQPHGNHVVQVMEYDDARGGDSSRNDTLQHHPVVQIFPHESLIHVWTNPLAGRDEGLALIGKRIRCFFPKRLLTEGNGSSKQQRRVLEGEAVSVEPGGSGGDGTKGKRGAAATVNHFPPWKVDLLVDKSMLDHFPFLIRADVEEDATTAAAAASGSTTKSSKTRQRNSRLEQLIRGENKVTVKMRLQNAHSVGQPAGANSVKWVIQKRVPTKLFKSRRINNSNNNSSSATTPSTHGKLGSSADMNGESSLAATIDATTDRSYSPVPMAKGDSDKRAASPVSPVSPRPSAAAAASSEPPAKKRRKSTDNNTSNVVVIKHVGDGNDAAEQQVANWRWLASRYHDYMLQQHQSHNNLQSSSSSAAAAIAETISAGLVGEVVKVEATSSSSPGTSSSSLSSLASVTIRRLVLPELTATGRLPHHGLYDICSLDNSQQQLFQIPVEELIVISRTIQDLPQTPAPTSSQQQQPELYRTYAYSLSRDKYTALVSSQQQSTDAAANDTKVSDAEEEEEAVVARCCHKCRRSLSRIFDAENFGVKCTSTKCPVTQRCSTPGACWWCKSCLQSFQPDETNNNDIAADRSSRLPCCAGVCDCRNCLQWVGSDLHQELYQSALDALTESESEGDREGFFSLARSVVKSVGTIDFGLPHDFLDVSSLAAPAAKPMVRIKTRKAKQWKRSKASGTGKRRVGAKSSSVDPSTQHDRWEPEDYSVFKPTCSRLLPYVEMKRLCQEYDDSCEVPTAIHIDRPRNLRLVNQDDGMLDDEKDANKTTSRAARVKQRRFLKGVAGISSLEVDTLAGRESQLRFGRSGIHAWGVYADADITAGDMIVEYRGELIENAMAEKREKEYEAAKIGSDYMFRIDNNTVCDATKLGNVARFINASCDPNCYTKIITVGSVKRIVIYAKRDISAGVELCYDYKFALEYDESKRIPCHCGARNCRGFMNWDKRYVAVDSSPEEKKPAAHTEPEQESQD